MLHMQQQLQQVQLMLDQHAYIYKACMHSVRMHSVHDRLLAHGFGHATHALTLSAAIVLVLLVQYDTSCTPTGKRPVGRSSSMVRGCRHSPLELVQLDPASVCEANSGNKLSCLAM